jgi:hypothetical protein
MPTTSIIDNQFAALMYESEFKIVRHAFRDPVSSEAFRAVLRGGITLLQQHEACKWLSDNSLFEGPAPDDAKWAITEWFPQARAAGWKFWAMVVPEKLLPRFTMKEFTDAYTTQGLRVMVFTQFDEAFKWLKRIHE